MTEDTYEIVAANLRAAIDSGDYAPGQQLPSGPKLAEHFGVHRGTVYKALETLATEGYLALEKRRPAVVRERPRERMVVRDRAVYRDEIGYFFDQNAKSWRPVKPPTHRIGPPPNHIADALGTTRGDNVLTRERVMAPPEAKRGLQLAISYLPLWLVAELPVIGGTETGPGGIYDRIEEHFGQPIHWHETIVGRSRPTTAEQVALSVPASGVVLVVTRAAEVERGGKALTVEVNETSMPAEQFAVSYAVTRHESAAWPRRGS
ncbi:GntR family transcriptional regulator [Streptomyces coffeae]|uniref:GntR family transcriptional regulator n=1 Tax=Streptomyces coffeae TaxID=621382 RepID=A0ABS1NKQ1_9ACTN|nr:GntR family transcriptional regulator [Streptomyces coffeae]MBL1100621.1 GntR family transcriptional regulator [Streptomyces coffeae]